jgi:2-polyprenyl-3-methyl-5-hydroxy-6-metoxy-1,4-benzoquinol methylase
VQLDPEAHEVAALAEAAPDLSAARILEVGCGAGRLTRRYAPRAGSVLAIDPDAASVAAFHRAMPPPLRRRVEVRAGTLATLGDPDGSFDVVLLAWSL